jgi:hypothetical protein
MKRLAATVHLILSVLTGSVLQVSGDSISHLKLLNIANMRVFLVCSTVGCKNDYECRDDEVCLSGKCLKACAVRDTCSSNEMCYGSNHRASCRCRDGLDSAPAYGCQRTPAPAEVCQYNQDCPPHLFCDRLNRVCRSPCMSESCGDNAECYVENRLPKCKCKSGFSGNAYLECKIRKCIKTRVLPAQKLPPITDWLHL